MKTKVTQGKKQKQKATKPQLCLDCRKYYGDPKICPGCQAYREHQS